MYVKLTVVAVSLALSAALGTSILLITYLLRLLDGSIVGFILPYILGVVPVPLITKRALNLLKELPAEQPLQKPVNESSSDDVEGQKTIEPLEENKEEEPTARSNIEEKSILMDEENLSEPTERSALLQELQELVASVKELEALLKSMEEKARHNSNL